MITVYDNPTSQRREIRTDDSKLWGFVSRCMIEEKEVMPWGRAKGFTKSFTFMLAIPWGLFNPPVDFPLKGEAW